jgi:HEAT repeat protein
VILLWLGKGDVPKPQKEDFIATLVHFEDGCWDFYWYRAFFLAAAGSAEFRDCIGADWIVAKLVEYSTEHDPPTEVDRVVNPAIWATLLETDRTRAINALIDVLNSDFVDDDSRWKVFNLLEKIGTGNSEVVAGLTKLIDNSTDDEELQQDAAFFLGRIDPGNQKAINLLTQQLLKKSLPDWLDWLPLRAAYFLGTIDQPNQDAINYFKSE